MYRYYRCLSIIPKLVSLDTSPSIVTAYEPLALTCLLFLNLTCCHSIRFRSFSCAFFLRLLCLYFTRELCDCEVCNCILVAILPSTTPEFYSSGLLVHPPSHSPRHHIATRIMSSATDNENINHEDKSTAECYQEDALHYDNYTKEDESGPYKTHEQKLQRLRELDNQECCPYTLEEVYPDIEITNQKELKEQLKVYKQTEKSTEDEESGKVDESLNDEDK